MSSTQRDCIFCRIAGREVPAKVVYEDEQVLAFRDIEPQAPVHIVIIPRRHIISLAQSSTDDEQLLGHILSVARKVAEDEDLAISGYRVVNNCGPDALQSVKHLHFHLLGGRKLGWPPG